MRFTSALRLSPLLLVLWMHPAAHAEDAGTPADAQQKNPLPAAATPASSDCIDETGDYQARGKIVNYVIGLENKCDKRLKCKIFAYVVGARGPVSGQTTMLLGAKSSGAAAKKTYAMRVKAFGGTAQVSRDCREY